MVKVFDWSSAGEDPLVGTSVPPRTLHLIPWRTR